MTDQQQREADFAAEQERIAEQKRLDDMIADLRSEILNRMKAWDQR